MQLMNSFFLLEINSDIIYIHHDSFVVISLTVDIVNNYTF